MWGYFRRKYYMRLIAHKPPHFYGYEFIFFHDGPGWLW